MITDALLAEIEAAVPQKAVISEIPAPAQPPPARDPPAPAPMDPSPPPQAVDEKPADEEDAEHGANLSELDELLEALNSPALLDFEESKSPSLPLRQR